MLMKYVGIVVLLVAVVAGLVAAKAAGLGPFHSALPVKLAPPHGLSQVNSTHGWTMTPGVRMKSTGVRFQVAPSRKHRSDRLQVEVTYNGAGPSGKPFATARKPGQDFVAVSHLRDGSYRWWARYSTGSAASPWVSYSPSSAFTVDTQPPSSPRISSGTDPNQAKTYASSKAIFTWYAADSGSGIQGYWYELAPSGASPPSKLHVRTSDPRVAMTGIKTGSYVFMIAARDYAGNWGPVSTFRIKTDTTPPVVTNYGFSTFAFNPYYNTMTLNFRVDKPASVRIGVYNGSNQEVRLAKMHTTAKNQLLHFTWNGRSNAGKAVPAGMYAFYVRTSDAVGNSSVKDYSGLQVLYQRIVVSLSTQSMTAYDGQSVYLHSLVTTGNSALPTPTGHFTILDKRHPFTFISEDPPGSQYYYPPSPVQYAMLFKVGGYYIHDAPWRSVFGPGSNTQLGTPGQNYTGTHGCVNVPGNVAEELYNWAPTGTPVIVQQ